MKTATGGKCKVDLLLLLMSRTYCARHMLLEHVLVGRSVGNSLLVGGRCDGFAFLRKQGRPTRSETS